MNQKTRCFESFLWVAIVVLLTALPFVNKAFHIDDPFVLRIIENIVKNPCDPFAGEFDWFGSLQPIFQTTTNPPFISYYLSLFVAFFGYSEIALHCAMMLFLFLFGWGILSLAKRFAAGSIFPLLFVMVSPAVMVSGNVMRDTPAAGLSTAAVALWVLGTDRENRFYLVGGAIFAGLAMLTKYSAVILIPVLLIYPLLKRKLWVWKWIFPALAVFGVWCLQNIAIHNQMHIVYLTLHRGGEGHLPWMDKALGALVIAGSMIYLMPALVWSEIQRHRWICFTGCIPVGFFAYWTIEKQFGWEADGQYLFWAMAGAIFLYICLAEGLRRGVRMVSNWEDPYASDSLFLVAWLCAPLLFSILFVPFQAVRHLIVALPPLMLLGWRSLYQAYSDGKGLRILVIALWLAQATMGYLVATVDYQYAATYPMMVDYAKEKWNSPSGKTWFVGHWGWKFYAEKAGFPMRHAWKEFPMPGDIVLWPLRVHTGEVWEDLIQKNAFQILDNATVDKVVYQTPIPLRTQNFQGASFYAVTGNNIPYRFFQDIDLETLKIFRVKEYDPRQAIDP